MDKWVLASFRRSFELAVLFTLTIRINDFNSNRKSKIEAHDALKVMSSIHDDEANVYKQENKWHQHKHDMPLNLTQSNVADVTSR